jgi:hypothetical protein
MRQGRLASGIAVVTILCIGFGASALRWSPNELDIAQDPGSTETYRILLENEANEVAEVDLYVSDWQRDENGVNDLSLPKNGARWLFGRSFEPGETIEIRYALQLPEGASLAVEGDFRTWVPQIAETIAGAAVISPGGGEEAVPQGSFVSVERRVESVDPSGVASIALIVRTHVAFEGLTLQEVFGRGVQVTSLDAGGARFDTINRSSADWARLSYDRLRLEPGEVREVEVTVTTPEAYEGTYWCILHAESRAVQVIAEIGGTQIVSRPSVGLKVLVTAPGTEVLRGEVVSVSVPETSPVLLTAGFANSGNVQLVVTAEAQIIDQMGAVISAMPFSEYGRDYFRVLPGSTRTIAMSGFTGAEALPPGAYQAIVSFDYGGESVVVGVKGFRIR